MNTLKQQIAELTAKHNFNMYAESISNGIKHNAIMSKRNFISFDCQSIDEAKYLLSTLVPTNENNYISTAGFEKYKVIDSPYRMDIKNPAKPSRYDDFSLRISFEFNDVDIWINIPLRLVGFEHFKSGFRKVDETELHYFGGISRKKIGDLKYYTFKSNYVVNFVGAQKSLFCGIETNILIQIILNK